MDPNWDMSSAIAHMGHDQTELGIELVPEASRYLEGDPGGALQDLDEWQWIEDEAQPAYQPAVNRLVGKAMRQRQARGHQIAAEKLGAERIEYQARSVDPVRKLQGHEGAALVDIDAHPKAIPTFVDYLSHSRKHSASPELCIHYRRPEDTSGRGSSHPSPDAASVRLACAHQTRPNCPSKRKGPECLHSGPDP